MKTTRIIAVAVLIVASGLALHIALAQQPGFKRTDLQRHDLSVPGGEVVQAVVEIAPGLGAPKHSAELRTAWAKGKKASFSPYGKTQAQLLAEQDS
jgi:hypothetical protein